MALLDAVLRMVVAALMFTGCAPAGYQATKVATPAEAPPPAPAAAGEALAGGPSFAYQIAAAGGVPHRILRDIPPQRSIEEIELKYESDKAKRYTEKTLKPGPGLLDVVGMGLSIGLAPSLGAAPTAGNIARAVAGPGLMMAGGSGRQVGDWERRLVLARIMPWLPAQEAATPEEAAAKVRQALEQAAQGLDLGRSVLLGVPLPTLADPPAVVAQALKTDKQVWTWAKGPGILVTASATAPQQYKVLALHDDVSTWQQISGRLPRWCFVYLDRGLTSNGRHFLGYPQVLWQGKPYYFGKQ